MYLIPDSYGSTRLQEFNHYHDPHNGQFTSGNSGIAGLVAAARRQEFGSVRRSAIKRGLIIPVGKTWKPKRPKRHMAAGLFRTVAGRLAQRAIWAMS